MIDPLRQGYKKEGRVKKKGVEPNPGEGNTREKSKVECNLGDKKVQLGFQKW